MPEYNYTARDILQKEFKTKMRGYDPEDVDEYLDNVIKDYETFNKVIYKLQEENQKLERRVDQLSQQHTSQARAQSMAPKAAAVTNFDILKRLSNLEREVFGKKLNRELNVDEMKAQSKLQEERANDTPPVENRLQHTQRLDSLSQSTPADDLEKTKQFKK